MIRGTIYIIWVFFLLMGHSTHSQIYDPNREDPYHSVFVQTSQFDSSYLHLLDSILPHISEDTLYFEVLNDLAYYWHTRNLDTALKYTQQGLLKTDDLGDTLWYGRFLITQGAILLRQEKLDSAFIVLETAKTMVKESDLAFLNTQLGYVFERRGQLDKAADYALESLQLGKEWQSQKDIAMAYSDLSNIFWKQSKFQEALEYGLHSLTIFEERGIEDLDFDFTLYVVGNVYLELGEFENSIDYYQRSIEMGERYGFYNNLSDVYISLTELHGKMGQYPEAEETGELAVKYANVIHNDFLLMRSYLAVGNVYLAQNANKEAIATLKKSIKVATEDFGDEYYLSQAYHSLGRAFANIGQYPQAYNALEKYDTLRNKVFTAEADERIALLQTEFAVAQKENTIRLQKIRLSRQKLSQELSLIIVVLLLLLLGALLFSFLKIRKKRKLLEKQNKEKEYLLKEIHHRVKNNLEIVSSLLSLQSAHIKDANAYETMLESRNRVYSMSMIHQNLYQGEFLSCIEMKDYLRNLSSHIVDSFGLSESVKIDLDMVPMQLDVEIAIPMGLIINELITNAMKYSLNDKNEGLIRISLLQKDQETLSLTISDNGTWKIKGSAKGTGFGTQLIQLLTEQLEANLEYDHSNGTTVRLELSSHRVA